jgi:uncharacterized protein
MAYLTKFVTKYNIDNNFILLNTLSGAVDIVDHSLYERIAPGKKVDSTIFDPAVAHTLKERVYLFESPQKEEAFLMNLKDIYLNLDDTRSTILICPTYNCNLKCEYCFEGDLTKKQTTLSEEQTRIALRSCERIIEDFNLKPRFGIFGGEPFLIKNNNQVKTIIDWANSNKFDTSIPTNATQLEHFIEYLHKSFKNGVLQMTLDGDENEHNLRRGYKGNNGFNPFNKTTTNIDLSLKAGLRIFLRINLDRKNMEASIFP